MHDGKVGQHAGSDGPEAAHKDVIVAPSLHLAVGVAFTDQAVGIAFQGNFRRLADETADQAEILRHLALQRRAVGPLFKLGLQGGRCRLGGAVLLAVAELVLHPRRARAFDGHLAGQLARRGAGIGLDHAALEAAIFGADVRIEHRHVAQQAGVDGKALAGRRRRGVDVGAAAGGADIVVEGHAVHLIQIVVELGAVDADVGRCQFALGGGRLLLVIELHAGIDAQQTRDIAVDAIHRFDLAPVQALFAHRYPLGLQPHFGQHLRRGFFGVGLGGVGKRGGGAGATGQANGQYGLAQVKNGRHEHLETAKRKRQSHDAAPTQRASAAVPCCQLQMITIAICICNARRPRHGYFLTRVKISRRPVASAPRPPLMRAPPPYPAAHADGRAASRAASAPAPRRRPAGASGPRWRTGRARRHRLHRAAAHRFPR